MGQPQAIGWNMGPELGADGMLPANTEARWPASIQKYGLGAKDYVTSIPGVDALTTDQTGIILATFYADCLPIFYFDPRQEW